jgi:hypothetical protein
MAGKSFRMPSCVMYDVHAKTQGQSYDCHRANARMCVLDAVDDDDRVIGIELRKKEKEKKETCLALMSRSN